MKNIITADELFNKIKSIKHPPTESDFLEIEKRQPELLPLLLNEINYFSENPANLKFTEHDYIRHIVTLYILAYFRNKECYPLIIKLISHPGEKVVKLTGEVFIESLGRILASVYDGDLAPIKKVIEDNKLSPWIRSAALDSLMVLWKESVLSRSEVISYLRELLLGKLERKPSYVWDTIALIAYDLHPGELEELLREALSEKLIEPMVLNEDLLSSCVKEDLSNIIKNKENIVEGYIKSPVKELTWWLYPDDAALEKGMDYAALTVPIVEKKVNPGERGSPIGWRQDTVVRMGNKIGRNDPCYCGSGKKYKRCCGA